LKEDNVCYSGYFQSDKYFSSVDIKEYFPIKIERAQELKEKYKLDGSILGIQYRLAGDRVQPYMQHYHKNVSREYYLEAFGMVNYDRILLFSDNPDMASGILSKDIKSIEVVREDCVNTFILMSLCDNMIIGNSTFAWWGAYLGNANKIICPFKEWFGPGHGHFDKKDLFPEHWLKL